MHPVLFELSFAGGTRTLGTYGLFVALGIAVAGGCLVRAARRASLDVGATFAALACSIAGGFAGAWLTFGAVSLGQTGTIDAVLAGGGLVFFGAVPGGLFGAWAAGRWLRLDVVRLLDLGVPGMAAGHALGRIGCFLGGCCYGAPFDGLCAVVATHPLAPAAYPTLARHPTPLYEAAGLLALALAFALRPPDRAGDGARAASYLALYCVLRLVTELARGDAVRGVLAGGLVSTSQILAIGGLLVAAWLWSRARAMHAAPAARPQRD